MRLPRNNILKQPTTTTTTMNAKEMVHDLSNKKDERTKESMCEGERRSSGRSRELDGTFDRVDLGAVALLPDDACNVELDDDADLKGRSGGVTGPDVTACFVPAGQLIGCQKDIFERTTGRGSAETDQLFQSVSVEFSAL